MIKKSATNFSESQIWSYFSALSDEENQAAQEMLGSFFFIK